VIRKINILLLKFEEYMEVRKKKEKEEER